jgi:hypothetical protein
MINVIRNPLLFPLVKGDSIGLPFVRGDLEGFT